MDAITSGESGERENSRKMLLWHHVAIVMAYAACYTVLRHFSVSYWMLTATLRASCLLLVPRRYWMALVIGDSLALFKSALDCAYLGWPWIAYTTSPIILLCMPAVNVVLARMPARDKTGGWRVPTFLAVIVVCAIVAAIRTDIGIMIAYLPRPNGLSTWIPHLFADTMASLTGAYIGALTLMPMVLAIDDSLRGRSRFTWRPLIQDALLLVVPYLAIIVATARPDVPESNAFAQLAAILPVVSLTANHGKPGASLGAMLSSIALNVMIPYSQSLSPVRAEAIMAFVVTCALLATGPSRPIRTFTAHPRIRARIDHASFFFEQHLARIRAGIRRRFPFAATGSRQTERT